MTQTTRAGPRCGRASGRREFLRWLAASPLAFGTVGACGSLVSKGKQRPPELEELLNLHQFEDVARTTLGIEEFDFLAGGADDEWTLRANRSAFQQFSIRVRRLVDVREVDTSLELFGASLKSPILLAPMGAQATWHPEGELATVRGLPPGYRAIVSTLSSYSIEEIAAAAPSPVWFQLYPTTDLGLRRELVGRAEAAGCEVLVLTADVPVTGNRERQVAFIRRLLTAPDFRLGNFDHLTERPEFFDPGMTWETIGWLKENTRMPVVLKGIVTEEDAQLSVARGADGVIVSNHGGRQEESGRGTVECLPEVVAGVQGRIPVLIDGGIRRGVDVFKALGLGADAVCLGRPYGYGLAGYGTPGVVRVLEILQAELVRIMRLAGTTTLERVTAEAVVPA